MSRIGTQLKKTLIFVHRWMGVAFCLLFLLWFSSGMILMYWDYPEVSAADRLRRAPELDASRIQLSPEEAYGRLAISEAPDEARLATFDGRPVYRFSIGDEELMVYADDGRQQNEFPSEMTLRIASAWTGQPPGDAKVGDNTEEDQWTVAEQFQALRPMRKYTWPGGEEAYVSTVTGEVVQYTTRASRMGAYFGAIPHWLYFTPLRKHGSEWSQVVIWGSGLATVVAILGITIGIWMYTPSNRFREAGALPSIPYTGQKRWHLIFGLIFGPLACTWAFSGMLSMDPFPQWQSGSSDGVYARLAGALRGGPILPAAYAAKSPREAIAQAGPHFEVRELEFRMFAGEPFYLATAAPNRTRILPVRGEPAVEFDRAKVVEVLGAAALPAALTEVRLVTEYESYYLDRRRQRPLPVLFVQLNDREHSMFYVDPKTARIVQGYNDDSRRNRWLYHGLHSIDLPWLYNHRPAWDILVLLLLAGGTALCVTALVLAWRVLRRKAGAVLEGRPGS